MEKEIDAEAIELAMKSSSGVKTTNKPQGAIMMAKYVKPAEALPQMYEPYKVLCFDPRNSNNDVFLSKTILPGTRKKLPHAICFYSAKKNMHGYIPCDKIDFDTMVKENKDERTLHQKKLLGRVEQKIQDEFKGENKAFRDNIISLLYVFSYVKYIKENSGCGVCADLSFCTYERLVRQAIAKDTSLPRLVFLVFKSQHKNSITHTFLAMNFGDKTIYAKPSTYGENAYFIDDYNSTYLKVKDLNNSSKTENQFMHILFNLFNKY